MKLIHFEPFDSDVVRIGPKSGTHLRVPGDDLLERIIEPSQIEQSVDLKGDAKFIGTHERIPRPAGQSPNYRGLKVARIIMAADL